MSSTKLVEHQIDAKGRKFQEEKLDKVTVFLLSTTIKQLSSLLGLANYFKARTNYSVIAKISPAISEWVRKKEANS